MAKLSKKELQQIIERNLPGHKIVEGAEKDEGPAGARDPATSSGAQVEADTPDIASLRRKYLRKRFLTAGGEDAPGTAGAFDEKLGADSDDVDIVLVESKNSSDPLDRRSQIKAVLIDTKTKKIIGAQG